MGFPWKDWTMSEEPTSTTTDTTSASLILGGSWYRITGEIVWSSLGDGEDFAITILAWDPSSLQWVSGTATIVMDT